MECFVFVMSLKEKLHSTRIRVYADRLFRNLLSDNVRGCVTEHRSKTNQTSKIRINTQYHGEFICIAP